MAINRNIRAYGSHSCIFAETEKGFFGYVNDTSTLKKNTCSADTMDIYCIDPDGDGYHPTGWYGRPLTDISYSKATATGGDLLGAVYPSGVNSTSGRGQNDILVVDEHGTHYGLKSGKTTVPAKGYSTGVMHKSADEGYVFTGWKVTIADWPSVMPKKYDQISFVSTGGTTEENVTTFGDGYAGAVIITMVNEDNFSSLRSPSITIEALYEKLPVTRTITLDPNGGTVSQTSVECTGTYENAVAITPTLEGKTFAGWFDSAEDGERIYASTPLTEDSAGTLYAHWTDEPEPPGPGPEPSSRSGLMVRSSTSDYLVFSASTGDLVYAR